MKLTILGSSSALPTSERNPTAHVLCAHERFFLIDCGEGTQAQMRKNRVRFGKINNIFISHIHGDHVFGLYGLLSSLSLMGRTNPINICAPENYEALLRSHLADFDIHLNFEIEFTPLRGKNPFLILDDTYLTVTAFPLKHRIPAFGFLFMEKEPERKIIKEKIGEYMIPISKMHSLKMGHDLITDDGSVIPNEELTVPGQIPLSYAYCSDTMYFKRLPSFVKGVSLLYHEATFGADKSDLAKMTGHSTSLDAARVADEAGAGALIIGHFSSRYRDTEVLLNESRTLFTNTLAAEDGKTYDIRSILTK